MCLIDLNITVKLVAYVLLLIELIGLSSLFIYCYSVVHIDFSFLDEPWLTGAMWCR